MCSNLQGARRCGLAGISAGVVHRSLTRRCCRRRWLGRRPARCARMPQLLWNAAAERHGVRQTRSILLTRVFTLGLVIAVSVGCSRSGSRSGSSGESGSGAASATPESPGPGCAVGSASKFKGDTTLFDVRNECGRWSATLAQRDSEKRFTGFRDSVAFSVLNCPASAPVDSLIFGTIEFSGETRDASGLQLVFQRRGAWLSGVAVEGEGGVSQPATLRGLAVRPKSSQLTFWVPSSERTIILYSISLTCSAVTVTVAHSRGPFVS